MKWFYKMDQEVNKGRKAEISVMVRSVLKNVSDCVRISITYYLYG